MVGLFSSIFATHPQITVLNVLGASAGACRLASWMQGAQPQKALIFLFRNRPVQFSEDRSSLIPDGDLMVLARSHHSYQEQVLQRMKSRHKLKPVSFRSVS